MKKKTYIALISALTISGAFLLNGCSFELPGTDATVRCAPSPEIKSSAALLQMNPVIRLQNLIFSTKFLTVMIPSWYIQPTENPTH